MRSIRRCEINVSDLILRVDHLRAWFKTKTTPCKAVDDVSFTLHRGETLGIVGESGSGKSVLSLSLLQLLPTPPAYYPSGAIWYHDQDLLKASPKTLQSLRGNRLAMIFQDPMTSLNPYLTIERQLTEVLEVHKNFTRRAARKRAIDLLERVGIAQADKRIDEYPHQFSGGMRQRVMIAMALLCEPEILIADEPTTALDVTVAAQILELLRDLQRDFNTAIILISHDLRVVARVTQRVAVMYAGKMVEQASTEKLFSHPMHPYTDGLMHCVPRLDAAVGQRLTPIPGMPPDLSCLPQGCAFAPRCARASEKCRTQEPVRHLRDAEQHTAVCHHPLEISR